MHQRYSHDTVGTLNLARPANSVTRLFEPVRPILCLAAVPESLQRSLRFRLPAAAGCTPSTSAVRLPQGTCVSKEKRPITSHAVVTKVSTARPVHSLYGRVGPRRACKARDSLWPLRASALVATCRNLRALHHLHPRSRQPEIKEVDIIHISSTNDLKVSGGPAASSADPPGLFQPWSFQSQHATRANLRFNARSGRTSRPAPAELSSCLGAATWKARSLACVRRGQQQFPRRGPGLGRVDNHRH